MDFKLINREKYLQYFLSNHKHNISDPIMTEFLNDMISVSENLNVTESPIEIIKEIMNKYGFEGATFDNIVTLVDSDLLDTLTLLEIFSLLWFVSCKNIFTYEEAIYIKYSESGTIGKLLKRLYEIHE